MNVGSEYTLLQSVFLIPITICGPGPTAGFLGVLSPARALSLTQPATTSRNTFRCSVFQVLLECAMFSSPRTFTTGQTDRVIPTVQFGRPSPGIVPRSPGSIQDLATAIPTDSPAVLRSGPPTLCKSVLRVIEMIGMIEREIVICHCLPTRVFSVAVEKPKKTPRPGGVWGQRGYRIWLERPSVSEEPRTSRQGHARMATSVMIAHLLRMLTGMII